MMLTLENIFAKSFYYPIHENFPLEINLLNGISTVVYKCAVLTIVLAQLVKPEANRNNHACGLL